MLKIERVRWLFTLPSDYVYESNLKLSRDFIFYSERGQLLVSVDISGKITVYSGYAWDGCTPKFKLGEYVLGISDGYPINNLPATYHASLIHDVLYQFLHDLNIERADADKIFLDLMSDFRYKYVYYYVVRLFGWLFV